MKFSESMKLSRFSFCLLVVALGVSGCATKSPAPVAERVRPPAAAVDKPEVPVAPPRVARPGYYIVKPGDTLIRIALDNGQNYRDIAAWSGLENPNLIEVGQELRVRPPETAAVTRPVTSSNVEVRSVATPAPATPAVAADGVRREPKGGKVPYPSRRGPRPRSPRPQSLWPRSTPSPRLNPRSNRR
jgi:lipoprotein NlpD